MWCIFCRKIVIPANTSDSKAKFLAKMRSTFGRMTFNLNDGRLAKYYMFLKNQYHNEADPKEYFGIQCIGLQTAGYWCLSCEVSLFPSQMIKTLTIFFFKPNINNF
jgi:hypothetical protein